MSTPVPVPTKEQMQRAAMALESHLKVAVLTKDSEQAIAAVADWLKSSPAIDRRMEILAALQEMSPGKRVSVSTGFGYSQFHEGAQEEQWYGHFGENNCISGGGPNGLLREIAHETRRRKAAPVLVDGIPIDQLAAVMPPTT